MDFSLNLQPNQQFHAKLQNGNYTLDELRKFRKKNILEAKLVNQKMRQFQIKFLQRTDDIHQYQLPKLKRLCHQGFNDYWKGTGNFVRKLHKYFNQQYDLTQSQRIAMDIYSLVMPKQEKDKHQFIISFQDIRMIFRVLTANVQNRSSFKECIYLFENILLGCFNPGQFTILDVIQKLKTLEILYQVLQNNRHYYKHIISIVKTHLQALKNQYKSPQQYKVRVPNTRNQYLISHLQKYINKSIEILSKKNQSFDNDYESINFLQSIYDSYYPLFIKPIKQQYKNLSQIKVQQNVLLKRISENLYKKNMLKITLQKFSIYRLEYKQQTVSKIINLMIHHISIQQFEEKIDQFLHKVLHRYQYVLFPQYSSTAQMILAFIHVQSLKENSQDKLFDLFCNKNLFNLISMLIDKIHDEQALNRYYLSSQQRKNTKLNQQDNLFWLIILGYQIIQCCNISTSDSQYDFGSTLSRGSLLLKQSCESWKAQLLNKLQQRHMLKRQHLQIPSFWQVYRSLP